MKTEYQLALTVFNLLALAVACACWYRTGKVRGRYEVHCETLPVLDRVNEVLREHEERERFQQEHIDDLQNRIIQLRAYGTRND